MSWRMAQARNVRFATTGCTGSEYFHGPTLAVEVWGEAARRSGSTHGAFAYLWRRFGPPAGGCDDYKDLVAYRLTTPDPQIFLWLGLGGSSLDLSVGHRMDVALEKEMHAPFVAWERAYEEWFIATHAALLESDEKAAARRFFSNRREDVPKAEAVIGQHPPRLTAESPVPKRINDGVRAALRQLLRPVFVRDCPLNILGVMRDDEFTLRQVAPPSRYAGYGIPLDALDRRIRRWKREEKAGTP